MKKYNQSIWWLSQLNRLRSNMKTYLAWKYPDLNNEYDDLCNEAIENLTNYIHDNENTLPESWFINTESLRLGNNKNKTLVYTSIVLKLILTLPKS